MIEAFRKIFFALVAAGATFLCVSAYAQSGGATLQGTVSDSSGAVVPNAHIHILAELTGVLRDVDSNNAGFYLRPISMPGDTSSQSQALDLRLRLKTT